MLRLLRRRPAVAAVPAIEDGRPTESAVQRQVLRNQSRTAHLWRDTERDLVVANIVHEREDIRASRIQIIAAALIALIILAIGSIYSYRNIQHDRLVAQERRAAAEKPYAPQTVLPNQ